MDAQTREDQRENKYQGRDRLLDEQRQTQERSRRNERQSTDPRFIRPLEGPPVEEHPWQVYAEEKGLRPKVVCVKLARGR